MGTWPGPWNLTSNDQVSETWASKSPEKRAGHPHRLGRYGDTVDREQLVPRAREDGGLEPTMTPHVPHLPGTHYSLDHQATAGEKLGGEGRGVLILLSCLPIQR